MKRKRPQPAPQPVPAAPAEARPGTGVWDVLQVCLFTLLLFLSMTVQTGRMSVILPIAAAVLCIGPGPLRRLRERFCVPSLAFLAFGIASGIAALNADIGEYGVKEFYKLIASFSVAAVALARIDRRNVRGLLWGAAAVLGLISVLNTSSAMGGPLFTSFNAVIESLGGTFAGVDRSLDYQVNGIYNDANITAGLSALGALCGLHLTLTGKRWWERGLACLLTGMNGMGLFLATSRGGMLCFGLALLVYLAAVGRGERTALFFLILLHVAVTVPLSIPASAGIAGGGPLPTALTALCGAPVFLLYEFPARWAARKLEGHGAALAAVAAALVLAAGAYGLKAIGTTGPYTFDESGFLRRGAALPAGEYALETDCTGDLRLRVFRRTLEGAAEIFYDGAGPSADFVLTEPVEVVVQFWAEPGEVLSRAALSDGTELPLGYPLLPAFVANRMQQSLLGGRSMSMRIQYDKDGWELFKQRPLLGWGMGGSEANLTRVQPFYYESLFLHNHVLQVMCDCGLLGAVPFLAFMLGTLWLLLRRLWRSRKEGGDPLAAALLACWVMANAHGLMEITFSVRGYQCAAYTLLLLPAVLYGEPPVPPERETARRVCGYAFAGALCLYLGVFAFGLERHRAVLREMEGFSTGSAEAFMDQTRRWIRADWFDKEQNKLNFVGNAVILGDGQYEAEAARYASELRKTGTYYACTGVAEYWYLPRGELGEMFACTREAVAQEASDAGVWNGQAAFYREEVLPAVGPEDAGTFLEGVTALEDYLEAYNSGRREEIVLEEENRAFLDRARRALESGLEGRAALLYLTLSAAAEDGAGG